MPDNGILSIELAGQHLRLHPFRAAFWEEAHALLLADLHLGKTQHFRRAGIAVPTAVADANIDKLISLLLDFSPRRVLFLGDLFHSEYNRQWSAFSELTHQFADVDFELVVGNHDILDPAWYEEAGLIVHPKEFHLGPFRFSHHPLKEPEAGKGGYNLAGHIHPSVRLLGPGRQRLKLPCFYFGEQQGLLPAFGEFTGTAVLEVSAGDRVYVVAGDEVVAV